MTPQPTTAATQRSAPSRAASARARARDPLSREVKLLGALLGQVIVEQQGEAFLALVERVRRATIEQRRTGSEAARRTLARELDAIDLPAAEGLIRAFSLYFLLTNLAEEKQRVRRLRRRGRRRTAGARTARSPPPLRAPPRGRVARGRIRAMAEGLAIDLVLTAHPTEARRRTTLVALRRCYRLLERLDDPRLTYAEDAEVRRQLREEIALLWHTSALRVRGPLAARRGALGDGVLRRIAVRRRPAPVPGDGPGARRGRRTGDGRRRRGEARAAGDCGLSGTRPPAHRPFLRWGSWVGGDRDGNPNVTAATTREAMHIHADHVLHGYEAVARRLMQTVAAIVREPAMDPALARPARRRHGATCPDVMADLGVGSRGSRTAGGSGPSRSGSVGPACGSWMGGTAADPAVAGGYEGPGDLLAELDEVQGALVAGGLARTAWGDVQDLGLAGADVRVPRARPGGAPAQRGPRGDAPGTGRRRGPATASRATLRGGALRGGVVTG